MKNFQKTKMTLSDIPHDFSHGIIAYWRGSNTFIGGGDTAASLRKAEVLESEVDYVSTGGGTTLEFLGGSELPGLFTLNDIEEYKISA